MKELTAVCIAAFLVIFFGVLLALNFAPKPASFGEPASGLYYTSPTMATSSVGLYTPVNILANSGSRSYASICNTSPTSTNDLLLEFDATSTTVGLNAPAMLVPGNSCYEMTNNKLFIGNLYAIFSTNTATVETLVK